MCIIHFLFLCISDSVIISVTDPKNTFYEDLLRHADYFDFSKIPDYHEIFKNIDNVKAFKNINKGKLGLWKLEYINIDSIIILKAKIYSIRNFVTQYEKHLMESDKKARKSIVALENKAKGVPYACMKGITHDDYMHSTSDNIKHVKSKSIRSFGHKLYTIETTKVGFHGLDLKRKFVGNYSTPFGYNPL